MASSFPFPNRFDSDSGNEGKWGWSAALRLREPRYINDSDSRRLKADGNLSYLQFIELVRRLWENSYPEIPLVSNYGGAYASYPCIAYGMELKRPHNQEPKLRYRDKTLGEDGKYYIIEGQKFQNVVSFAIMTEADRGKIKGDDQEYIGAEVADRIIEIFEDFMLEYTPVFKRLGAQEFVYARRLADSEINMDQTDVVKRTVTYLLTTEKLVATAVDRIEKITTDIRLWIAYEQDIVDSAAATPQFNVKYDENFDVNIVDLYQGATPNS